MASKPTIKTIEPFDATKGVTIEAQYNGSLPYHNRVTVYDASNLNPVYIRTEVSSKYTHFIDPAYTGSEVIEGDIGYHLENGKRYSVTIQFFGRNITTDVGLVSDKQAFLTRTTPSFYFKGLNDGDTIDTSTINLELIYTQAEFEPLLNFRFEIYDNSGKNILHQTDIIYDTSKMSYSFKGLENMETYYVRAEGTTTNGMYLDTGNIKILTQYDNPSAYARMLVSNNPNTSEMNYRTNFIIAEADESGPFVYENGWIHLEDGVTCTYTNGFHIESNGTWFIRVKQAKFGDIIMRVWGEEYEFYLEVLRDTDDHSRIRLVVPNKSGLADYMLYSDSLNTDWITSNVNIWVRKIGDIYLLKAFVENDNVVSDRVLLGNLDPFDSSDIGVEDTDTWIFSVPILKIRAVAEEDIYVLVDEPVNPKKYSIWISDKYLPKFNPSDPNNPIYNNDGSNNTSYNSDDPNMPIEHGGTDSTGEMGDNGEPISGGDSVDADGPINIVEQGGTDSTGTIGDNGEPEPGSGDSVEL